MTPFVSSKFNLDCYKNYLGLILSVIFVAVLSHEVRFREQRLDLCLFMYRNQLIDVRNILMAYFSPNSKTKNVPLNFFSIRSISMVQYSNRSNFIRNTTFIVRKFEF